tara:strand:- start:2285 stop:2500 length:216 start_codon:yes stop_codon:yes gene_type:complete
MNDQLFTEMINLKKRIVFYYRTNNCFERNAIDRFAQIFTTYNDMIQALGFMKYEIRSDEFTSADFEEIYNR